MLWGWGLSFYSVTSQNNSPARCPLSSAWRWTWRWRWRWWRYTLLRNSPPVGCSGVLHSDEFLALSLLLLGSLSLIMSYWRQNRAITPEGERTTNRKMFSGFLGVFFVAIKPRPNESLPLSQKRKINYVLLMGTGLMVSNNNYPRII